MEATMIRCQHDRHSTSRSSTRRQRGVRPTGRARRRRAGRAVPWCRSAAGQTLVEFALVMPVFILLTLVLLDGARAVFYYSQIQEVARQGARWGAVQVARASLTDPTQGVGGTFNDPGNSPGTYCDSSACQYPLQSLRWTDPSNPVTATIVGAALRGTTAVNPHLVTISISTTAAMSGTQVLTQTQTETADIDPYWFTDKPVTVTVTYPFTPILSMGVGAVTLKGSSAMFHE